MFLTGLENLYKIMILYSLSSYLEKQWHEQKNLVYESLLEFISFLAKISKCMKQDYSYRMHYLNFHESVPRFIPLV